MKNKKTLNCKDVKFTKELSIYNPDCINNTFNYILRRCSTSKLFFKFLDDQLPNQLLYNTEEKEAYFLNSDRQLFKLKFEPINMKNKKKNQTTEEYLEELGQAYSKVEEIQKLAIPWNKFYCLKDFRFSNGYCLSMLNRLFVDLLHIEKKEVIRIKCGIGMMQGLEGLCGFDSFRNKIQISSCTIITELDFNVGKHDLVYNGIVLIGEDIVEKEEIKEEIKEVKQEEPKPKKKFLGLF
jgi:hypothetical protein